MSGDNTFSVVDSANYGANVVRISTAVGIIWTLLIFLIRMFVRVRIVGPFGFDDIAAGLGTALAVGQSAATFVSVRNGVGNDEDLMTRSQIDQARKASNVAALLYILVICASKSSVSLLIVRLTRLKYHLTAAYTVLVGAAIWAAASLCGIGVLQSKILIDIVESGEDLIKCWTVIEAVNVFLELGTVALSIYLVWDLQMTFRIKALVVMAFSCRILIAIPTLLKISYLPSSTSPSSPFFYNVNFSITMQAAMHFSIMSATFPCMKQFLNAFDTEMGHTINLDVNPGGGTLDSGSGGCQSLGLGSLDRPKLRPDISISQTLVRSQSSRLAADRRPSSESEHSNKAIIRKGQAWEVRYENVNE